METENKTMEQEMASPEAVQRNLPQKPFYKTGYFWEWVIGGLAFLCAVIFVVVALNQPRQSHSPEVESTTQSPTTEPMEATLPLPEANPIGPGDFAIVDGYLTCLTAPSVLGIDVSFWQADIDWQQVKAAGVEFAMIRAGWRGSEKGVLAEDTYAQANYAGAAAAGVKVGAYFFSQAISPAEAVEEAEYLLELIKDWNVEMPIVFDWEYIDAQSRTGKIDARTLTDCTKAFCDRIAAAGYQPMVYFNAHHSYSNIYIRELTQYPFWLARYDTVLDYPYKVHMWQYSDQGKVPGISGNVDLNLFFP